MVTELKLGDIMVDVIFKDIKNIHLSVHPPTGRVRIAAPSHTSLQKIRAFAISKLGWIKKHQRSFDQQERETPREFLDRESHYVWGRRYLLKIIEVNQTPRVELAHRHLKLYVRPGVDVEKRHVILDAWYREQLRERTEPLFLKWEAVFHTTPSRVVIRRMRTRWGSCSRKTGNILLNTELARKPFECVEYVVLHEFIHLLEPTHNDRFRGLLDLYMSNWEAYRRMLNQAPLAHEDWGL